MLINQTKAFWLVSGETSRWLLFLWELVQSCEKKTQQFKLVPQQSSLWNWWQSNSSFNSFHCINCSFYLVHSFSHLLKRLLAIAHKYMLCGMFSYSFRSHADVFLSFPKQKVGVWHNEGPNPFLKKDFSLPHSPFKASWYTWQPFVSYFQACMYSSCLLEWGKTKTYVTVAYFKSAMKFDNRGFINGANVHAFYGKQINLNFKSGFPLL